MEGERGSVAGIELLTRTSLNSLRDANQVYTAYLWETLNPQPMDDRNWSWSYLRRQFRLKDLEELYLQYQHQLHRGYFTVFLFVQLILSVIHALTLIFTSNHRNPKTFLLDIFVYCTAAVLCWPLLILIYRNKMALFVAIVSVLLLVTADLGLPIYHIIAMDSAKPLRPAYTTLTLLAIYAFLPIVRNRQAVTMGIIVSLCHLAVLGVFTYKHKKDRVLLLLADGVYMICVNGLGLYFRFVNEVVIRRTFLDRRACVESTLKLNYEKEQEEQLMLSILPKHIAARVKSDIRNIFQHIKTHQNTPLKKKPFSDLYVEQHENVTILYADVVNYSQLTVSLLPNKLVETLNELFGRFDEASEERGVLRIKFLGDCYYCVSGVPQPNPNHARCCVDLGLDMIGIIQSVREDRKLNVDMRIGVHSGKILSGLLGVCKWQYDIWSRDVIIANHMEQSGEPGRVHVTKETLCLLGDEYEWEPGAGAVKDPLLAQYNIETFLIAPRQQCSCGDTSSLQRDGRYSSPRSSKDSRGRQNHNSESSVPPSRRHTTQFMDNNLIMYQQMLKMADESMATAIQQMPIGNYRTWIGVHEVNPICLTFHHQGWELPFLEQPDPLFKFYVGGSLAVLLCMLAIQALDLPSSHKHAWLGYGVVAVLLLMVLPFTWTHFLWNNIRDPHQEMDLIPEPQGIFLRFLYRASVRVVWSNTIRTGIYLVVTTLLATCALIDLTECNTSTFQSDNINYLEKIYEEESCLTPWHITQTSALAVLMCFLFVRVHFQLKLAVSCCIMGAHAYSVLKLNPRLFKYGDTLNPGLDPQISHVLSMFFLTLTLHLMDRQAEYMNRLDYRWKRQLSEEQEEAATTRMVNKMLLQNILPIHVADIYLNTSRPHEELYHEQYESVAVLFASIQESTQDTTLAHELSSLEILNQIICGFDKLLFEPSSLRVEKIKVGGRTYMAACGLEPGRRDSNSIPVNSEHNIVILARFAANMLFVLNKFNMNNNHNFHLTIGIAHGAVTAGVVGSQKPLYDIWGDAVNMASRMDSTGVPGRIQVTEESYKLLEMHDVLCELRGPTFIKGKNYLTTYFIAKDSVTSLCTLKWNQTSVEKKHV